MGLTDLNTVQSRLSSLRARRKKMKNNKKAWPGSLNNSRLKERLRSLTDRDTPHFRADYSASTPAPDILTQA